MNLRTLRRFAPLALPLALGACRNQSDSGEELSYIRTEVKSYAPQVSSESLLPLRNGARWELQVANEGGERLEDEQQRVVRTTPTGGTIETLRGGKVVQTETYRVTPQKIELLATGIDKSHSLNPPLTLLALPVAEESVLSWQGTAGSGDQTFAGQAFSRPTRRETVQTPAGAFAAWRVDTRTELTMGGRRELVHLSRWFSPGIGIVRQRVATQGHILIKELKKLPDVETTGVK